MALAALLAMSAFFSGSETAVFSLGRLHRARLERRPRHGPTERALLSLLADPKSTLAAILVGNLMVNVAASMVVGTLVHRVVGAHPLLSFLLGTIIATIALLIVGEILPKTIAVDRAEHIALIVARPLLAIRRLLSPIGGFFNAMSDGIFRVFGLPAESHDEAVTEVEIKGLVTLGHDAGVLGKDEREMIDSVMEFAEETVDRIMTPRVALQAFPVGTPREEIVRAVARGIHSRTLIYKGSIDRIVGVLHTKDVLLNPNRDPYSLMRRPLFVHERRPLTGLLHEFRRGKQHMAVVVDEYGGTSGCVTLNDLMEEIFGGLPGAPQAFDPKLRKIDERTYEVDGLYRIGDLNDELELNLPEDDSTTISGLICNRLSEFPKPQTRLRVGELTFVVERMAARRVARARLILPEPSGDTAPPTQEPAPEGQRHAQGGDAK